MRLYLKNIGFLKEADVKLDGLTVIAGENDTGKSTVGKVIFSILKGLQKYEESLEDKFKKELLVKTDKFYDLFRKINKDTKLNLLFLPPILVNEILKNKNNLDDFLKKYQLVINSKIRNKDLEKKFEIFSKDIKQILLDHKKRDLQEEALRRAFFSEFRNQLKLVGVREGIIKLNENNKEVIKIKVINKNEMILDKIDDVTLEDVTLVETPMILNFSDMIQHATSYFEEEKLNKIIHLQADVIYHSKDLINKLVKAAKYGNNNIDKNLSKILRFDFEYNNVTNEFEYVKNSKRRFPSLNVSDGIKSFGIIKLLLKGGFIRKDTLLVVDEPEVHLHPKWQVEYAKLLVNLVKNGINILVTSHSPFFIDAIDKLSYDININYYFAEDGLIKEDKDLELMYKKLNVVIDELEDLEIDEMVYKVKNESSKK